MMCCNICPFHPISGNTQERCLAPVCSQKQGACSPGPCARLIPHRCLQDEYVITQLYRSDRLARRLAPETFETALVSRNQPLLLCLFHAAPTELALHFWQRMKEEISHLMHLLNSCSQNEYISSKLNFSNSIRSSYSSFDLMLNLISFSIYSS